MTAGESYILIALLITVGYLQSSIRQFITFLKLPATASHPLGKTPFISRKFLWLRFAFDSPGIWIITSLKIILAITLIWFIYLRDLPFILPLAMILVDQLAFARYRLLSSGETPLQRVVLLALAVHLYFDDPTISNIGLGSITAFLCLAYFSAGRAKLQSPGWRSGFAMEKFMGKSPETPTDKYIATRRNQTFFLLSRGVIFFELFFFVSLALPEAAILFMMVGLLFHGANSIFAGINNYFWAFVACYPAIYFTSQLLYQSFF